MWTLHAPAWEAAGSSAAGPASGTSGVQPPQQADPRFLGPQVHLAVRDRLKEAPDGKYGEWRLAAPQQAAAVHAGGWTHMVGVCC
jgi:hypothetical protein